jgi:hypothetical protein
MAKTPSPDVVAGLIQHLGGTLVEADTLRFNLPLSEVRTAIPRLNQIGVGCRKISERVENGMQGTHGVATIECFRRELESDHASDLAKMLLR